jgi:hypothetical protein
VIAVPTLVKSMAPNHKNVSASAKRAKINALPGDSKARLLKLTPSSWP